MLETGEHFISLLVALNDFKFSLIRHLCIAPAKFSIRVELFFSSNTLGVELRSLTTFTNLKSKRTELVKKQLADYIYFFSAKTCICLLHFCLFEVSVERIDYEKKTHFSVEYNCHFIGLFVSTMLDSSMWHKPSCCRLQ